MNLTNQEKEEHLILIMINLSDVCTLIKLESKPYRSGKLPDIEFSALSFLHYNRMSCSCGMESTHYDLIPFTSFGTWRRITALFGLRFEEAVGSDIWGFDPLKLTFLDNLASIHYLMVLKQY